MNQTCAAVAPEVSEFDLAGLTPLASRLVAPPHIAQRLLVNGVYNTARANHVLRGE